MSNYSRTFKTIEDAIPLEGDFSVGYYFTLNETAQLMRMYAHARYIAVQASRGADRCDRENHHRGMIHYIYLLRKAAKACLDIESKMREWEK